MPTDTTANNQPPAQGGSVSPCSVSAPRTSARRPYDDSPRTGGLFARLAQLEDGPEREVVRDELVNAWLPMAYRVAGRFHGRGEALEDLRQVAAVGLIKAVDRFDADRGAFESYAVPTITGEVKRHFRDRTWAVRVPRRVQELRNQVRIARRELAARPGPHEPTNAEIAVHAHLSEEEVATGMGALESYSSLSLDAELAAADEGYSLADTMGETDSSFDLAVDREATKKALSRLSERERTVLYLRFFEDMTQSRIAERFGISQMHVSRIISRTCARVRADVMPPL
ncbi:SigB/SigF/SigG family RNA polymerase sigma factor [Streptomyces sp. NPDC127038]|uniref:SigB/SigF/SigG family RNA polymerase sigma factor n=1 Tax=Streptomyces sp. NPDC127038 TaxID=3347114 RepID=UPI003649B906